MADSDFSDALQQGLIDFDLLHQIVQGDASVTVTTEGGDVPSVAKIIASMGQRVIASLTGSSNTPLTVGLGSKTLTVEVGKAYSTGQYVVLSNGNNMMAGMVVSYINSTLVVNVLAYRGSGSSPTWVVSFTGPIGKDGIDGDDGLSAYQIAVQNGFVGTEAQWLASLKGEPGQDGTGTGSGTASKLFVKLPWDA